MISIFNFKNGSVSTLSINLMNAVKESGIAGATQHELYNSWESVNNEFNDAIRKAKYSLIYEQLNELSNERHKTVIGLKAFVKSMLHSPSQSERAAAELLNYLIYNCGKNLTKNVQNGQSAFIVSLLNGLQGAEYVAAIATLHLVAWVSELQSQQTAFEALVSIRIAEKIESKDLLSASNLRQPLFDAINNYIDFAHSMSVTTKLEGWTRLEHELQLRYKNARTALTTKSNAVVVELTATPASDYTTEQTTEATV